MPTHPLLSRAAWRWLLGACLLLTLALPARNPLQTAQAAASGQDSAPAPGQVSAEEWSPSGPFPVVREYVSEPYQAGQPFAAVGVRWRLARSSVPLELAARTSADGLRWGDWLDVQSHGATRDGEQAGDLISPPETPSRWLQWRAASPAGVGSALRSVNWSLLGDAGGPTLDSFLAGGHRQVAAGDNGPAMITRAQWGADERLRYVDRDPSKPLIWPIDWQTPEKVVLHDTTGSPGNIFAFIRLIYYYHAITLGWGDIGYNYLVDSAGNIYEGRAGGSEAVVAGHVFDCFNYGSVGISFIGDHSQTPTTTAEFEAYVRLVTWIMNRHGIDPYGHSIFGGATFDMRSLSGHIDLRGNCKNTHVDPGFFLYRRLDELRGRVATAMGYQPHSGPDTIAVENVRVSPAPAALWPGTTLRIQGTIRNNGTGQLASQGTKGGTPEIFIDQKDAYRQTEDYVPWPHVAGKARLAVELEPRPAGLASFPYRWSLGPALDPGEAREFDVRIALEVPGQVRVRVAVVWEGAGAVEYPQGLFVRIGDHAPCGMRLMVVAKAYDADQPPPGAAAAQAAPATTKPYTPNGCEP